MSNAANSNNRGGNSPGSAPVIEENGVQTIVGTGAEDVKVAIATTDDASPAAIERQVAEARRISKRETRDESDETVAADGAGEIERPPWLPDDTEGGEGGGDDAE